MEIFKLTISLIFLVSAGAAMRNWRKSKKGTVEEAINLINVYGLFLVGIAIGQ